MAIINFVPSTSASFSAATDTLQFAASYSASNLQFQQGASLQVGIAGQYMSLLGASYASLTSSNLNFADGSLFRKGTAGGDALTGGSHGDYFDLAAGGNDSASGGDGDDTFVLGDALTALDSISGGTGTDTLRLSGTYASSVVLGAATVTGVEQFQIGAGTVRLTLNDTGVFTSVTSSLRFDASAQGVGDAFVFDASLLGVPLPTPYYGNLQIIGGAGNDTLYAGAGSDHLNGGAGDDVLRGGANNDSLFGGTDNDQLFGELGQDTIYGNDGNDQIDGGDGNDSLNGGAGNDVIVGGAGDDAVAGGMDADTLTGGSGNDTFRFDFGTPRTESSQTTIDTITDFTNGDRLDLPGTNYINGLPLATVAAETPFRTDDQAFSSGSLGVRPGSNPGDGFVDVLWRYSPGLNHIEVWVDGNDDGQFSEVDTFVILDSSLTGKTSLSGSDFVDNFVAWRGTDNGDSFGAATPGINIGADNIAYALGGNDTLDGGLGSDQLYGGADNDTLSGGDGNDYLYGGSGADTLDGGSGSDSLYAEGNDRPGVAGSDAPGTINVLNGGWGNDSLTGSVGDDQLNGQGDNDSLSGGAGIDVLEGGDG
ncbi:calcium-binding protein, partial [Paucibacter soli]|uniref:calcium-binding protein n=1 Tax=Paucibacter soli TaxID=3133433 RepID=UPI0030A956B8